MICKEARLACRVKLCPSKPQAMLDNIDWIIPTSVATKCFGKGIKSILSTTDDRRKAEDQFASSIQFVEFKIDYGDFVKKFPVIIKWQPQNEDMRKIQNSKVLFSNEITMFTEILPIIENDGILGEIFCKYYNGYVDNSNDYSKDFVLLEDVGQYGYRLSSEKGFLDYKHLALAMKQLGRFHGLSYLAKKHKLDLFKAVVSKLKNKHTAETMEKAKDMYYLCGKRGIQPLIEAGRSVELLEAFLHNYDNVLNFFDSLLTPSEVDSVVCHGDFCRNNMLFRYDQDGAPVSVKFIDLQTSRYASPVIDLSFFLFMNTNKEMRDKHWDDLISIYKEGVKEVYKDEAPELNFRKYGVYGYLLSSFFLPQMLTKEVFDFNELAAASSYARAIFRANWGGEEITPYLTDIVEHLLERGFIRSSYY